MRKTAAFALAIAGIGTAAYLLPEPAPVESDRIVAAIATPRDTTAPPHLSPAPRVAGATEPRVFSPNRPLLAQTTPNTPETIAQPTAPTAAIEPAAPAARPSAEPEAPRRLTSSRPADADARTELVKDLQRELKRVGCYEGDINGAWAPGAKKAMAAFTDRVNATLPLDEPDYILLTLVQGHSERACGAGCPTGQVKAGDGKCSPRAVVAEASRALATRKNADKRSDDDKLGVATVPPAKRQAIASISKSKSTWSTIVETSPQRAPEPRTVERAAPPPAGRMTIGARDIAALESGAPLSRDARSIGEASIAAVAPLQSEAPTPTRKSARPPLAKQPAADDDASKAAKTEESPSVDRPVRRSVRPAASAQRAPAPRVVPAPQPRIVVMSAPRPAYAPAPTRWTRTIFNDITRMR